RARGSGRGSCIASAPRPARRWPIVCHLAGSSEAFMNVTTQRKPSAALLRGLVIENPLFLLSALMVLGGAWLLNPPAGAGSAGRPDVELLAKLFLAIQLYEIALIAAGAIFVRRGGLERDVRNLALVLAPFLVDVTMTTSTLSQALFLWTDEPLSYLF